MVVWNRRRPADDLDALVHHSDMGVPIAYTERLPKTTSLLLSDREATATTTLSESFGLYKWELIYRQGPWRGLDDVEFATMTYERGSTAR